MPSPVRRSTRAAAAPSAPAASVSSSTSLFSARLDRPAQQLHKQEPASPHSPSSEEMSDPPRRSKRAHLPNDTIEAIKHVQEADEEVAEDDGEITRCLCGHAEYPGPPLSEAFDVAEAQADDAGGLFIQCDGCSVWQHGGCVGIVDESQNPDKYFCEQCRPKQHEVHIDTRGYVFMGQSQGEARANQHVHQTTILPIPPHHLEAPRP